MNAHPHNFDGYWIEADGAYFTSEANVDAFAPCPLCASPIDMEPDSLGDVLCRASSHRFAVNRENGVLSAWTTSSLRPMEPPVVYADEGATCPACDSTVPILDGTYSDVYYDCPTCGQELAVYSTPDGTDVFLAAEDDPFS